ncbi:MAG: protein jag [Clostridia bacterium]|nr:protein jag [Clostridia bacterium]
MKEIIVTGATLEEAIAAGCAQLEAEQSEVEYEVLEQPQQKILGLFGGAPAKVRVYIKDTPASVAIAYLTDILTNMGVKDLEITEEVTEERTILNINGDDDDLGVVIGHRGDTLTALQYLVSLTANNACDGYFKVSLNVKNFREKREKTLETVASKTAFKASKLQKNIALEPMSPYERSIIHTAVQSIDGVTSWSVGENEKRHVVIGPEGLDEGADGIPAKYAKLRDSRRDHGGRGGYGKGSYGRGDKGGYNRGGRGGYGKGERNSYSRNGRGGYRNRNHYSKNDFSQNTAPVKPKSDYEGGFSYGKISYGSDE